MIEVPAYDSTQNSVEATVATTTTQSVGRDRSCTVGFIGTMPRSGTWYVSLFFDAYSKMLKRNTIEMSTSRPIIRANVGLGVQYLAVIHAVCPGFRRNCGPRHEAWETLTFFEDGYDVLAQWMTGEEKEQLDVEEKWIRDYETLVDPGLNAHACIIYLYRNPLDQVVSVLRHGLNSTKDTLREYLTRFSGPRDFFFYDGLDAYIKQYFTYKYMKGLFPYNLMLVTYEQLMRNPESVFSAMLDFLGHDMTHPKHKTIMKLALGLASKDSVRKIEQQVGASLAGDQIDPQASHIKDSAIGKWKKYFSQQDVKRLEVHLERFDIAMDEFIFE